jgi:hypothetical protein
LASSLSRLSLVSFVATINLPHPNSLPSKVSLSYPRRPQMQQQKLQSLLLRASKLIFSFSQTSKTTTFINSATHAII